MSKRPPYSGMTPSLAQKWVKRVLIWQFSPKFGAKELSIRAYYMLFDPDLAKLSPNSGYF